ncbi:MAG: CocE/NonD family hydrolase [Devosia sp.]
MSLTSHFLARAAKLPPRQFRARLETGVRVPMHDGVTLETVLASPLAEGAFPTLLMRCPYGLRGFVAVAEIFAEHGYRVVLQACRGTGASGGTFEPLRHEREDGLATLRWIETQPWFDGRLGTTGPSYLGYAQWAIADSLPERSAMSVKVSSAEFRTLVFPGGGFHIGLLLSWMQLVEGLKRSPLAIGRRLLLGGIDRVTSRAALTLPLENADLSVTGRKVPFWRTWLAKAVGDDNFWQPMDHTSRLGQATPPVSFVSGWYDMMLDQLLRDYRTLVGAGKTPQLTIGPWWHISAELQTRSIRETLSWMDYHLKGHGTLPAQPVRLYLLGRNEWRSFDSYPPVPSKLGKWYLQPHAALAEAVPPDSPADRYRYDPNAPTPNVGGAIFAFSGAGPVNQSPLERRKDVLLFTSPPIVDEFTIIGKSSVILFARTGATSTDFLIKLCDVDARGTSINVCDGYHRHTRSSGSADDVIRLDFALHSVAHTFRSGHRLRILVASGAHPRFARNTGSHEPFGTATTLLPAGIEIFHNPAHPSSVTLPVCAL